MIFRSLACACALKSGARNRSGFTKTSAAAVRSVLRNGLEHPSRYQTARAGLAASTAIRLYRAGQAKRYKPLFNVFRISVIKRTQTARQSFSVNFVYVASRLIETTDSVLLSPKAIVWSVPVGIPLTEWRTPPHLTRVMLSSGYVFSFHEIRFAEIDRASLKTTPTSAVKAISSSHSRCSRSDFCLCFAISDSACVSAETRSTNSGSSEKSSDSNLVSRCD